MRKPICDCYGCIILNSPTVASSGLAVLPKRYLRRDRCWGVGCNKRVAIWALLIKLAIIIHGKPMIRFESTISLLRKLTRDFLFLFLVALSRKH